MRGITIVRVAATAMMIIHATYRIFAGGVAPFGEFLGSQGFPAGAAIAWLLTIVEIAGGLLLVAGRFVRPLCVWFPWSFSPGSPSCISARAGSSSAAGETVSSTRCF